MTLAIRRKTKASLLLNDDGTPFYESALNQDIDSTITWTAGTAPTTPAYLKYSYHKVGKLVVVQFKLEYTVAGATVTAVAIDKPSALPNPAEIGTTDNSEVYTAAAGGMTTNFGQMNSGFQGTIFKSSGGVWQFRMGSGSASISGAFGVFSYFCE